LTRAGAGSIGVVLDFEEVRVTLGLPRVSVDYGDMDFEAAGEYNRLNHDNRMFVKETRAFERSDPTEAVVRYRRALATLSKCRELAHAKGLAAYGFQPNQTDAIPIDRLTVCLLKMGQAEEAATDLENFIDEFPHTRDMRLLRTARERIDRARRAIVQPAPQPPSR
jgi:hypothetical protein